MRRVTFSDDTTTGRWSAKLRGPRRVTIVARAEDGSEFNWFAAFKRDFLPQGVEAKSINVLPVLDNQPLARRLFLSNVEGYSIFVVDFHEFHRQVLENTVAKFQSLIPPGLDPYEFILDLLNVGSNARQYLRQIAINRSALGQIESLLEWASNPLRLEMGSENLKSYFSPRPVELASRLDLAAMDERQIANFLARLGSAVGDALSPEKQAQAILETFEHGRFFASGNFAYHVIRAELETDHIYDTGSTPVRVHLETAHRWICEYLDQATYSRLDRLVRRGVIEERPSDIELGIQAADIAAALASREYESAVDIEPRDRARAVKGVFARVFLNSEWL